MTKLHSPKTRLESRKLRFDVRHCAASLIGAVALAFSVHSGAAQSAGVANLSVQQIVEKNIAARGGLQAWQAVQTMAWTGKMDAGTGDSPLRSARYAGASMVPKNKSAVAATSVAEAKAAEPERQVQLPFVLQMKRPGMSRLELEFNGKTAVQVYDGREGWKLRPFLNRNDWEPFTAEELKVSAGQWQFDGPLLDASSKGTKVDLEGVEAVDGHEAYRLKLQLKNGSVQHVWVDAKTFLDVRIEGAAKRMDGRMHQVYVTQSDFHQVQGIMVPRILATKVDGHPDVHKMLIEKVSLNVMLADGIFTRPKPEGGV